MEKISITIELTPEQIQALLVNRTLTISASSLPGESREQVHDPDLGQATCPLDSHPLDFPLDSPAAKDSSQTYFAVFEEQIQRFGNSGSLRTQETYRTACNRFRRFLGGEDIAPAALTTELAEAYQAYLRADGISLNTISFYMRILRAVYNRCVERGLTENNDPFRRVYTGIARTAKRALTLDEMRRLKNLTTDDEALAMARDLFLFSFYTRGMSFVDIAYLRKADVRDGVLSYKRRKTGQLLTLAWEPKMQEIVDRHPALCTQYLLPIIHTVNGRERNQYRNRQTRVNVALKEVARLAGIGRKLTMYCARHSWATIARQVGVSVDVISRGMGHNSRRTTEIYLSTVDVKTIDKANRQIMDELERNINLF